MGIHLGLDELEPLVDIHDSLRPVLLDENGADQFVDVCVFVQDREFLATISHADMQIGINRGSRTFCTDLFSCSWLSSRCRASTTALKSAPLHPSASLLSSSSPSSLSTRRHYRGGLAPFWSTWNSSVRPCIVAIMWCFLFRGGGGWRWWGNLENVGLFAKRGRVVTTTEQPIFVIHSLAHSPTLTTHYHSPPPPRIDTYRETPSPPPASVRA